MRTIAFAALLAAPALSKALAQSKDDTYAKPAYEAPYEVAEPTYKDDSYEAPKKGYKRSYSQSSRSSRSSKSSVSSVSSKSSVSSVSSASSKSSVSSRSSYSKSSRTSGSNYSVSDHDQYHNNEDNNQSPYVDYAQDTTT